MRLFSCLFAIVAASVACAQSPGYRLTGTEKIEPVTTAKYPNLKWQTNIQSPSEIQAEKTNSQNSLDCVLDVKTSEFPTSVEKGKSFSVRITAALSLPQSQGQYTDEAHVQLIAVSGATVKPETKIDFSDWMTDTSQSPVTLRGSWAGDVTFTSDGPAQLKLWITWNSSEGVATWEGGMLWNYEPYVQREERLPIIFIPGVAGSELYDARDSTHELWPLKYNPTADRRDLAMDPTGAQGVIPILAKDVIRSVTVKDFYGSFIDQIKSWGYKEGEDFEVFPYDWRLDNRVHMDRLDALVNAVRARTGKPKIILITHSMGGLVARYYLTHGGASKVEKHIAISPPNKGSAKVYWAYIMGYTFGNDFANPALMKFLYPNLPAGYQLMPFDPFVFDIVDWRAWALPETFALAYRGVTWIRYGMPYDNWETNSDWNWHFNQPLAQAAREFQQALGTRPAAGVEMHSIIGWGIPSVSRFEAYHADPNRKGSRGGATKRSDGVLFNFAPGFETGDGTVPESSLEGIQGDTKYYIRDLPGSRGEHTAIIQNPATWRIVRGILDGKVHGPADLPDLSLAPPTDTDRNSAPDDPFVFTIQCPADLHVYDEAGNHDGLANGAVEELIPSSCFLLGDDEQTAAIGRPHGHYKIRIDARGEGVLTLIVSLGNGPNKRSIQYRDVPISNGSVLTLDVVDPKSAIESPADLIVTTAGTTARAKAEVLPLPAAPETKPVTPPNNPPVNPPPQPNIAGADNLGWTQTLVYHQLTTFSDADSLQIENGQEPRLSASGNRIVMSLRPSAGDPNRRSRVAVIDADATNFRVVDTSDAPPLVDISADGSEVVSQGASELRTVKIGEAPRLILNDSEIGTIRMRADGKVVYFCQNRDFVLPGTQTRLERGVYSINVDGSGLRKIVGASQICSYLGVPADNLVTLSSGTRGASIDVSTDGSKIVFLANAAAGDLRGEAFTMNTDGSGLTKVADSTLWIGSVGISGNGARVAWTSEMAHANNFEGWTSDVSGGSRLKLSDYPGEGNSISLSEDGRWVLFGMEAKLYSSDGREKILLAPLRDGPREGWFYEPRPHSVTMSHDAARFAYAMDNPASYQMTLIERAPTSFGEAPRISDISVTPAAVVSDPSVLITAKARVECATPVIGELVSAIFMLEGEKDGTIGWSTGLKPSTDGFYVDSGIYATRSTPTSGVRRVRIKAETEGPDKRRHATIIEVDPLNGAHK